MNINYIPCGDYFIPDFAIALETESLGKYGRMRHTYLREHRPDLYQDRSCPAGSGLICWRSTRLAGNGWNGSSARWQRPKELMSS